MRHPATLTRAVAVVLALCAVCSGKVDYPEPKDSTALLYFCPPLAQAPELDGKLDDACWQRAPIITDFGAIHRGSGLVPKQTFMQIVYGSEAVYVGVRAAEPKIAALKLITGRDGAVYAGDSVEIYLRPNLREPVRYQLVTNAAGARWDAWIIGGPRKGKADVSWGKNATWSARGHVDVDEWTTPRMNPDGTENKFEKALKDFPRNGYIGFQDHGDPVWYRNVRIKEL